MPFLDRLNRWAELTPHAPAIDVDGQSMSFLELRDAAAAELAAGPRDEGGLSALSLPNGTDFVVQFAAGVAKNSRCAVLDPSWPPDVRRAVEERLSLIRAITLPTADEDVAVPLEGSRPTLTDGPGESVFLYGFTSGTTSVPKAFIRSRESWQLSFTASADYFGLTRDDRTLAPGPFSSSLTLYALCESLYAGAGFFTLSSFDVGNALSCLSERSITRLVAVPSALHLIAERALSGGVGVAVSGAPGAGAADAAGAAASGAGLSSIISAGSKLQGETLALLHRWAPNATNFEYYGAAELGFVAATVHRPADERMTTAGSPRDQVSPVGMPFPGVEVRIHDDEGRVLGPREVGNITIRSGLVSGGYAWGDDGDAFHREGEWCTVGDQGYLDEDGMLNFLGRRADMVTTGGHNVYPHEVEAVLQAVPGVRAAFVTGLPDPRRGHRLVAAILRQEEIVAMPDGALPSAAAPNADVGADDDLADALRHACRAALIPPKRPRAYYAVSDLPLTASGKPSRSLLARWILDGDPRVRPL